MNAKPVIRKSIPELAAGDRVCWHNGAGFTTGTVTAVSEIHTVPGVNGPVFTGITVHVDVAHYPTWDDHGWPVDEPRMVAKRFNTLSAYELEWAYTPEIPALAA